MVSFQLQPGSGFVIVCYILFNYLTSSTAQTEPDQTPSISSSVASHICRQQNAFQDSGEIQSPLKAKPENDDSVCGWYLWTKCDTASTCDESPSFKLLPCEKAGRTVKTGSAKTDQVAPAPGVLITFKQSTAPVINKILAKLATQRSVDRVAQRISTIKSLRDLSSKSHKSVIDFIKTSARSGSGSRSGAARATSLWLTNQILLQGADPALIAQLKKKFSADIAEISEDKLFKFNLPPSGPGSGSGDDEEDGNSRRGEDLPNWGVERIEADKVWAEGNRGEGVIVGLIDGGVRATHNFLKTNFIGPEKGWFDPVYSEEVPFDRIGHGTFTTGIVAATEMKIGVAPGSKWMHCVGCDYRGCWKSSITRCFQWMLCPSIKPGPNTTDDTFNSTKCEGAPQVISNSWTTDGYGTPDPWINNAIKAVAATGVLNVFAAGNSGPKCESVHSPSELEEVICVGAMTINNTMPWFSARGPYPNTTKILPDLVAPGDDVISTAYDNDTAINVGGATSFSTPYVSGVVVLLVHEKPDITMEQVKECLYKTATPLPVPSGEAPQECGGVPETTVPNNVWGYGNVNAYKAVQYLKENFKD